MQKLLLLGAEEYELFEYRLVLGVLDIEIEGDTKVGCRSCDLALLAYRRQINRQGFYVFFVELREITFLSPVVQLCEECQMLVVVVKQGAQPT
ncbi:unnamed protein product [Schistosoma rodhaini]|uniref:Uncharacterized protein n=1 Tax=Schistosoma rodhaini TaxID=6188 RepID=A0AA85EV77_9TREM|nr:unnamed protein product [Schistosoma rodhaini]